MSKQDLSSKIMINIMYVCGADLDWKIVFYLFLLMFSKDWQKYKDLENKTEMKRVTPLIDWPHAPHPIQRIQKGDERQQKGMRQTLRKPRRQLLFVKNALTQSQSLEKVQQGLKVTLDIPMLHNNMGCRFCSIGTEETKDHLELCTGMRHQRRDWTWTRRVACWTFGEGWNSSLLRWPEGLSTWSLMMWIYLLSHYVFCFCRIVQIRK